MKTPLMICMLSVSLASFAATSAKADDTRLSAEARKDLRFLDGLEARERGALDVQFKAYDARIQEILERSRRDNHGIVSAEAKRFVRNIEGFKRQEARKFEIFKKMNDSRIHEARTFSEKNNRPSVSPISAEAQKDVATLSRFQEEARARAEAAKKELTGRVDRIRSESIGKNGRVSAEAQKQMDFLESLKTQERQKYEAFKKSNGLRIAEVRNWSVLNNTKGSVNAGALDTAHVGPVRFEGEVAKPQYDVALDPKKHAIQAAARAPEAVRVGEIALIDKKKFLVLRNQGWIANGAKREMTAARIIGGKVNFVRTERVLIPSAKTVQVVGRLAPTVLEKAKIPFNQSLKAGLKKFGLLSVAVATTTAVVVSDSSHKSLSGEVFSGSASGATAASSAE